MIFKEKKYPKGVWQVIEEFKKDIGKADPRDIPKEVVKKAKIISGADQAGFYLYDKKKKIYITEAIEPEDFWNSEDASGDYRLFDRSDGTIAQATEKKKTILITDIDKFLREGGKTYKVSQKAKSELVVPIFYQDEVVGAFFLSSDKINGLTVEDEKIFSTVVPFAGMLYKERLLLDERNRVSEYVKRRVEFLLNVWGIKPKSLDELYEEIFQHFNKMLPVRFISVWHYTQLDDVLILKKFWTPERIKISLSDYQTKISYAKEFLMDKSIIREKDGIVKARVRIWKRDSDKWISVNEEPPEEFPLAFYKNENLIKKFNFKYFIPLPLTTRKDRLFGFFCIHPDDIQDFTPKTFEAIAKGISTQLELWQFQEREEFINYLNSKIFPQIIQFEDSIASWGALAQYITGEVDCEACSIFIYNPIKKRLELKGTTGILKNKSSSEIMSNEELTKVAYNYDEKEGRIEGAVGYCFHTKKPYLEYAAEDPIKSEISQKAKYLYMEKLASTSPGIILGGRAFVPIYERGNKEKVIGVIRCVQKKKRGEDDFNRFRQDDIHILSIIANAISMFWANYQIMNKKERERDDAIEAIGHEAMLPLTAITWHIDLLKILFEKGKSEEFQKKVKDLEDEVKHLTIFVSSLPVILDIAPYKFEKTKIFGEIIFKCKSLMESMMRAKGIRLDYNDADVKSIPPLYIDEEKITQVIYNVLHNAVKYSDNNTTINIRVRRDVLGYYISFENYGIGVLDEEREKIFEKYTRGSNVQEKGIFGTGLGLCTCRRIMRKHGGDITLEKNKDPTIFTLFFPKRLEEGGPE